MNLHKMEEKKSYLDKTLHHLSYGYYNVLYICNTSCLYNFQLQTKQLFIYLSYIVLDILVTINFFNTLLKIQINAKNVFLYFNLL